MMRQEGVNGGSESEQMFISKTQTWTVEYEDSHTRGDQAGAGRPRASVDDR